MLIACSPMPGLREESYDGLVPEIHLAVDHPGLLLNADQFSFLAVVVVLVALQVAQSNWEDGIG